jgi:transposase
MVFEIEKENEGLASNHAVIDVKTSDRIGEWKHHPTEAVLLKNMEGRKTMSKAGERRLCVGIDLHKTQFTTAALNEDGEIFSEAVYLTNREGYDAFIKEMHQEEEEGYIIELAVESTGNARFFKNQMEAEGFFVTVVNTNQFKVITVSTKKTDTNDAETLAFYLMKKMLPEAHLCDQ